ncbi:MAG: prolipoprotein diacylglyceryl transferase [Campylobacterales bacterium]|nr:prolipoprotein diacylglyceryl transferase [Campylobacterales bacterium]
MELWQSFFSWHDPVALDLGFLQVRWYGLMYVLALGFGYFVGRELVKRGEYKMTLEQYDMAFIWVEVGVILGARIGYVLFYDENTMWYLTQPWEIFNPFYNGEFVGISGLSYHGAIVGFLVAGWLFTKRENIKFLYFMDLSVLAGSAGYFFGRVGNFLNDRLVGRETDVPWGIFSHGALRHPAMLYEAFLEGIVVASLLFILRKYKKFDGQLMALYVAFYATARFIVEFYRQPDPQLGFIAFGWLTMGQLLSFAMFSLALVVYKVLPKNQLTK